MDAESKKEIGLEIGHVLFIDIVGYSKLLITEQSEQLQALKEIVRATEQFRIAEAVGKLLRSAHDLFQLPNLLALFVDEQFGVTDDVDEQDVPDLKFHL